MANNPKIRVCYRCKCKRVEADYENIGGPEQLCSRCRILSRSDKARVCLKCGCSFTSLNGYRLCNSCKGINSNYDISMVHAWG